MSMMMCMKCDGFIDTDYDCECWVGDDCVCLSCQEVLLDEGELVETDGGELKWVSAEMAP
jgi:hypothetical protein